MGQRIEPSVFSFERVLAAFLFLASPGCFVLVSEVDIADCDRGSGACSVTQPKVYGEKRAAFSVADLTGAELAPLPAVGSRQGRKPGMRVVFLTRTGTVPFMRYSTDIAKGEMREQVEAVTRFVATPTERTLH